MHDAQIAEFDGALASALVRPQLGYYEGLVEEAAALLESPAMKPPLRGRQQANCIRDHRRLRSITSEQLLNLALAECCR